VYKQYSFFREEGVLDLGCEFFKIFGVFFITNSTESSFGRSTRLDAMMQIMGFTGCFKIISLYGWGPGSKPKNALVNLVPRSLPTGTLKK
jgi:hypothetical protein